MEFHHAPLGSGWLDVSGLPYPRGGASTLATCPMARLRSPGALPPVPRDLVKRRSFHHCRDRPDEAHEFLDCRFKKTAVLAADRKATYSTEIDPQNRVKQALISGHTSEQHL